MTSARVLPAAGERDRILLATAEIWSDGGYETLSVGAIATRAEISAEIFGSMFSDLEAVARATLEAPIAVMVSLVGEQFSPDRPEPESCMRGIVAILSLMAANPAYAHVVYIGRKLGGVPAAVNGVAWTAGGFMVAMLDRLRQSSAVGGQPVATAVGALGAAEAVVRREVLAGRADRLAAVAPSVVYGATAPLVGQKEGLRLARLSSQVAEEFAL
jgi:AcrR family transcriptional regulator